MIAHFDVDAFYASVEIRDNPALRGKPVAVAGTSRRAVVLTASYEARPFGVRSAVPLYRALLQCPQLIVVRPNMEKYRDVSREIFDVFRAFGEAVEGLSMDEAFVDFGARGFADAMLRAESVRVAVRERTGLTVSAGVAAGKMVAKILSDSCKPNGCAGCEPGKEAALLAPLPVGKLWGIGPKTQTRLEARGITTIGALAALDDLAARSIFGSYGVELRDLARGIDVRRVESQRETKSISTEETFEYDVVDEEQLRSCLQVQALELAESLAKEDLSAQTVGIKVKRHDCSVLGRQTHLSEPTREARRIYRAALFCLRRAELTGTPVRLLGTRVASLTNGEPLQVSLFGDASARASLEVPRSECDA